jgi:phosphatidylserine/phosphatidylglycerophosphate/cardiolipin synthase-like enzyme
MNAELFEAMKKALRRGVNVDIGWGMPEREDDERERKKSMSNRQLLVQLKQLEKQMDDEAKAAERVILGPERHKHGKETGKLRVVRLGDTHEKILIVDERWSIATSFNWLSFRGDPNRGLRNEVGYMVKEPKLVREHAGEVMARLLAAAP